MSWPGARRGADPRLRARRVAQARTGRAGRTAGRPGYVGGAGVSCRSSRRQRRGNSLRAAAAERAASWGANREAAELYALALRHADTSRRAEGDMARAACVRELSVRASRGRRCVVAGGDHAAPPVGRSARRGRRPALAVPPAVAAGPHHRGHRSRAGLAAVAGDLGPSRSWPGRWSTWPSSAP